MWQYMLAISETQAPFAQSDFNLAQDIGSGALVAAGWYPLGRNY